MDGRGLRFNISNRSTILNPNATEFIPSALRSTIVNTKNEDETRLGAPRASGAAALDRSGSNVSGSSDDEVHQYWRHQLPDDITPDFKFMAQNEFQGHGQLSLAGLSINDALAASGTLGVQQDISNEKLGYSSSASSENQSSESFMTLAANSWNKQFINGDRYFTNERNGLQYNRDPSASVLNDLLGDDLVNHVEFLASKFPGFSAKSLADVFYANGCDLNLTIEIVTQLEREIDGGLSPNPNSKALAIPSFNVMDFTARPVSEAQNEVQNYAEEDFHLSSNTYRSMPNVSKGAKDFASTIRKLASQESALLTYERNNSAKGSLGSSQLLTSSYNGHEKLYPGDKLRISPTARAAPVWLETGEAVANMYSESREEAHDLARLRNVCFEQARQASVIGNKALAKELTVKGQLYGMKMQEAHGKARETIFRKRNPIAAELQGGLGRGQDHLIDLHGLHVSEAIQVLKHELGILRSTARSAGRRLQVMVSVGTGHHTKGPRAPTRLPVAVEQYLLEEGLHYTQPQLGLLRVLIY